MKKIVSLTTMLFAFATLSFAQGGERQFQKFKGEISLGYATFPGNSSIKSGFIFALEPKFLIMDELALFGRFETNLLFKEYTTTDAYGYTSDEVKLKIYESFNVGAEYYFTKNYKVRPFAGVGGGVFLVAAANSEHDYNTTDGSATKVKFGGLARIGVEVTHFRFAVEYNLIPNIKANYDDVDNNGNYIVRTDVIKNSYIGIKAGVCFGGGPKERKRRHRG
jgi:hypothetical protein